MTPPYAPETPEHLDDATIALVESLEPNPAYVLGSRWDVLHANAAAQTLFRDWDSRGAHERNILWYYVCDPAARGLYVDWEAEAAHQLAFYKRQHPESVDDPMMQRLLDRMIEVTPQAREWWEEPGVSPKRDPRKRIRLSTGGELVLRQIVLAHLEDPRVVVVAYFSDTEVDDDDLMDSDDRDDTFDE